MKMVDKVAIGRKWAPVIIQLLEQRIECNNIQAEVVFQA